MSTTTDGQTDGQAKNNKDNVLSSSLLIGLSVIFFAMVARARACGVCVQLCVCYCKDVVTKNSQTYFCKHPTFISIHVTKRYM